MEVRLEGTRRAVLVQPRPCNYCVVWEQAQLASVPGVCGTCAAVRRRRIRHDSHAMRTHSMPHTLPPILSRM